MRGNPVEVELFHTPEHLKKREVNYRFICQLTAFAKNHYDITYYIRRGSTRLSGFRIVFDTGSASAAPKNLYLLAELVIYYGTNTSKIYIILNENSIYYTVEGEENSVYLCSILEGNKITVLFNRNFIPIGYASPNLLIDLNRIDLRVLISNHIIREIIKVSNFEDGIGTRITTNEPITVQAYSENTLLRHIDFSYSSSYMSISQYIKASSSFGETSLFFKHLHYNSTQPQILLYFERYSISSWSISWILDIPSNGITRLYLIPPTLNHIFFSNDNVYIMQNCVAEYLVANRDQRERLNPGSIYDFTCVIDVDYYANVEQDLNISTFGNDIINHYTDPLLTHGFDQLNSDYEQCMYRGKFADTPHGIKSNLSTNIRELEYQDISFIELAGFYTISRVNEDYKILVPESLKYDPFFSIKTSI